MANADRVYKLLVRTSLVTSTTIATLIGAQSFAMLDMQANQNDFVSNQELPAVSDTSNTSQSVAQAEPSISIVQSQPSITILRHSANNNTETVIVPPSPSEISAPDPVVIQQPVTVAQQQNVQQAAPQAQPFQINRPSQQRSRSSR